MIGLFRRLTHTLPLAAALALGTPALATAAQSMSVTSPTGFPAGGDPSYTTTTTLDTSAGTPSTVTVTLAPGVLAAASANPRCVTGAPAYTSACQIGSGSASTAVPGVSVTFNAYLVPPPSSADVVGIDLVTSLPGGPVTHAGARLVQNAAGNVSTVLSLDLSSLGAEAQFITGMTLTVNGTLGGKPFTRMPTRCSPGSSTLTVVYANRTETTAASPDFAPTGCSALPYAPTLTGTAVVDSRDQGVAVSTTVRQAADEAASASTTLLLPWPTVAPNLGALSLQNTSTPVGTATSATPLLSSPLKGTVFFTGSPLSPTLTIRFPPPAVLTLTGTVSPRAAFGHLPDGA